MKKKIVEIGKKLGAQGFTPGISGNISVISKNGMLISASGTKLSELSCEDIVLTDLEGKLIKGKKKPSSEKNMHLLIYKARPDIKAIIHCHSPKTATLAACHIPMDKKLLADCVFYLKEIPVAPYALPGSDELANNTVDFFKKGLNAVMLANHGIIIGADSLKNALYLAETAEFNAEVYINSMMIGKYKSLDKKAILEIENLRNSKN